MIEAVIFDFDGTLMDTEKIYAVTMKRAIKEETGLDIDERDVEENAGMTYREKMEIIFGKMGVGGFDYDRIAKESYRRYKDAFMEEIKIQPGVKKVLRALKDKYKIGLYSPNDIDVLTKSMEKFAILEFFDLIISKKDIKRAKPDPEGYFLAAKKLGVKPENCLVFEDTPTGFTAAKAAGMRCIVLKNPYLKNPEYPDADGFLDSFDDFDVETIGDM